MLGYVNKLNKDLITKVENDNDNQEEKNEKAKYLVDCDKVNSNPNQFTKPSHESNTKE